MKKMILRILFVSFFIILISSVVSVAVSDTQNIESSPEAVYENPRRDSFGENLSNFGIIFVGLLLLVLAKSIFDYIRVKNQSLLISY